MTIVYTPEVKRILKASGFSDEEIATSEVRANQAHNYAAQPMDPMEEDVKLPPRFSENSITYPVTAADAKDH